MARPAVLCVSATRGHTAGTRSPLVEQDAEHEWRLRVRPRLDRGAGPARGSGKRARRRDPRGSATPRCRAGQPLHRDRRGWRRGRRCGSPENVAPDGKVIATDLETDFLQAEAAAYPTLEVLQHDITAEELPTGFDLVHARWLTEWLPDKRRALRRMVAALRPGGVLLDEEPDFVTVYETAEPPALRRVVRVAMRHLEATCPVDCEYGRRLLDDVTAVGLVETAAEGRCPVVRGGSPAAAHFLRLTLEKLKPALVADQRRHGRRVRGGRRRTRGPGAHRHRCP